MTTNNSVPTFFAKYQKAFRQSAAHAFILHGNVTDYVGASPVLLRQFMNSSMALAGVDCTVWYSPASGLDFPTNHDREAFMRFAGLQASGSDSNILAQMSGGANMPKPQLPREPAIVFGLLDRTLRTEITVETSPEEKAEFGDARSPRIAVIIEYANMVMPNAEVSRMTTGDRSMLAGMLEWGRDSRIGVRENRIFLICESMLELHSDIRRHSSGYMPLEIRMPDHAERLAFILPTLERYEIECESSAEYFAQHSAGLSRFGIESIVMAAVDSGTKLTNATIQERKKEIITNEFAGMLTIMEGRSFADIGGNEKNKAMFRDTLLTPMSRGDLFRIPKGYLAGGPAGTGKSVLFSAVAGEGAFPMLQLHLGNLRGGIMGESEKNLQRVISLLEALAPCGVFIDEIDQVIKRPEGRDGSSGVASNEFARLTEFMADDRNKGRIIFFGATNRSDLLDAATRREGRFDMKFIVDAPQTNEEREAMFTTMLRSVARSFHMSELLDSDGIESAIRNIGIRCDGYTGAELKALAERACGALYDGRVESMADAIEFAIEDFIPTTADVARMRALAYREINSRSMLPDGFDVASIADEPESEEKPVMRRVRK